jgi:predicted XRE-type DNA-binding protein
VVKTKQDIMPSYNTVSSTIYDTKKWKEQLQSLMASCEIVKAMLKKQALKQSKLTQLYKVSCTQFTTIH